MGQGRRDLEQLQARLRAHDHPQSDRVTGEQAGAGLDDRHATPSTSVSEWA